MTSSASLHSSSDDNPQQQLITQSLHDGSRFALRASPPPTTSMVTTIVALPVILPIVLVGSFLMMVKPLQHVFLSWMIPRIMARVDRIFHVERRTLLSSVHGHVLDVGSGGGAYMDYCHAADHVVAVEPIIQLHPTIRQAAAVAMDLNNNNNKNSSKQLTLVRSLDELFEHNTYYEYFDWILLGNVLCEVPDVSHTLQQLDRLLRPGGRVYFSEHIARPVGTWTRRYQNVLNPLWRYLSGGCNCNRDSLQLLQAQGGWQVIHWQYEHVQVGGGPFVLGLALKEEEKQGEGNNNISNNNNNNSKPPSPQ